MYWVMGQVSAQAANRFLWAPVLFGCGIAVYFGRNGPPSHSMVVVLVVLLILSSICFIQPRYPVLRLVSVAGFWFIFGYLNASLRAAMVAAPVLGWNYYGPVEGRIVGLDRSASNAPRMVLDQISFPGERDAVLPARIRLSAVGSIAPDILQAGQRVTTTAFLSPPAPPIEPDGFDFRRYAWFEQLGAVGYSRNPVIAAWPLPGEFSPQILLLDMRMDIADWVRAGIPGVDGAFAAAIISGDRSEIDPSVMNALRASNLAHLLAISGLHMGLLSGFVFMLLRRGLVLVPGLALRRPIKKYAAFGALLAAAGYLLLSGGNVATQRAFIMAAVVLIAVMVDRPALTLRAVALAALIVLLVAPESLMEAGFQMSFAATTALVATYRVLRGRWLFAPGGSRWRRGAGWVLGVFVTSAIGGLSTAPYSAFHFNVMSQFGLLANVLAVPMMGLVVMPAAVLAAVLAPFGWDGLALDVMGWGISWILLVAEGVASLPGAVRPIIAAHYAVLALATLAGLMLCLMRGPLRLGGVPVFMLSLVIWSQSERPDVLIDPDGRLLGQMTEAGRGLNKEKSYAYAAENWLQADGDGDGQASAFLRGGQVQYQGGSSVALANGWTMVLHWGPDAPSQDCAAQSLFVFSRYDGAFTGPCKVISPHEFAAGGARAIWVELDTLRVVPTLLPEHRHYWQIQ